MACKRCHQPKCCCKEKVITKYGKNGRPGRRGKPGPGGTGFALTVRDQQGVPTIVNNVTEIQFTDPNAFVTNLGGGVVSVSLVPPATVWNDIMNLDWYNNLTTGTFRPQYTIEGNRISFRGLLFIPLDNAGNVIEVANGNSYLLWNSAVLHEPSVSIITNANTNNGTPQGRFMTSNVTTKKNFPAEAIPVARDVIFNAVPCARRFTGGGKVANYRSFVDIRIGAANTVYRNGASNFGTGCIMVFSPFNSEYDGAGTPPLGNDPLALGISRATNAVPAVDFINATDDNPFAIPSAGANNPFSVNAHHMPSLGGFVINLEGLSGYLN